MTDSSEGKQSVFSISNVVGLIAVVSPLFYLAGRAYSYSWLTAVGGDAHLIEKSTSDYLYYGYVAILSATLKLVPILVEYFTRPWLIYFIVFFIASAFATFLWQFAPSGARTIASDAIKEVESFAKNSSSTFKKLFPLSVISGMVVLAPYFIGLLTLYAVFPYVIADEIGKEDGAKRIEGIRGKAKNENDKTGYEGKVIFLDEDGQKRSGNIIDCGGSYCIIFFDGKISTMPRTSIVASIAKSERHG